MDPLFSALYGDPTKWDNFTSDYPTLNASFGKGTTAVPSLQSNLCRDGLAQLATRTPVALAFVSDAECDCIYVAHSITIFPADVTEATVMDNLAVGLLGDRPDSLVPVVFPQPFFSVCAAAVANNVTTSSVPLDMELRRSRSSDTALMLPELPTQTLFGLVELCCSLHTWLAVHSAKPPLTAATPC